MIRAARRALYSLLIAGAGLVAACDDPAGGDLNAPRGLAVSATTPSSITLTFTAVSGAAIYNVQRAAAPTGEFATVGTTTTTTFTDENLTAGTTYRYRVQAVDGSEVSEFSTEITAATANRGTVTISSNITTNRRLSADTVYTLGGFIQVGNGATLTVDAGTRVEGNPGSALFILPGARIDARGTAERPIVFTSSRSEGSREPGDWGGLILIGNGVINRTGQIQLEGTGIGATNPALFYGVSPNPNNADNSGTLRYVRIEFAGFGPQPNAELNSLTMAAVGSGTTIEYVQTLGGLDDSFEWFGGAVDARFLVSYETGDDHFDASEGYVGRVQYMIALQTTFLTPRQGSGNLAPDPQGIENDGCDGANCPLGQNSQPFTIPMFANFTLVGTGNGVTVPANGGRGMMLRRGTGGYYVNGVVARWPRAAISLRDQTTANRVAASDLILRNLLLAENGVPFEPQAAGSTTVQTSVDLAANAIDVSSSTAASLFTTFNVGAGTAGLDWTPSATSPAATGGLTTFPAPLAAKAGTAITATSFRGAAPATGANVRWWAGWTVYAQK